MIAKLQVGQTEDESKHGMSVKALRLKGKQDRDERPPLWWNSSIARAALLAKGTLKHKRKRAQQEAEETYKIPCPKQ